MEYISAIRAEGESTLLVPQLGVELPESVQAQAGQRRHPRQLHTLGNRRQLIGERAGLRGREPVSLGLSADQGRGLNGRNVVLGLVSQYLPSRQLPEIPRAENAHGPQDFHLTRVVGRLGQLPRPEHGVEVTEVTRGGYRGLLGIKALVDPAIDAKAIATSGGRHELPETLGPGP